MLKCSVPDCDNEAHVEVFLYDFYPHDGEVFFEHDKTCGYLCRKHVVENEKMMQGVREPRGGCAYPYTNRHRAQGFTVYQPIYRERKPE